jgi:4-hydroxy-tetrahydrodipicolinate synthase
VLEKQILYTACVTPFKEDGEIDFYSLETIIKNQESSSNGVLILGSTGESLSLSSEERRTVAKFASDLNLKTELILGIPSYNLKEALEFLKYANDLKIDGYLATTPIYTKPGIVGQTKWFETILETSKYPCILYNIPGRSGIRLHNETVKNLSGHKKFVALKDSGGTIDSLVEYKIAAPNLAIFCGDDNMIPSMASEGAVGLISVASNSWPLQTRKYVQLSLTGHKFNSKLWWQASKALFAASNPIPIKALMKEIGLISSDNVRTPLAREDLKSIDELLYFHNQIIGLEN